MTPEEKRVKRNIARLAGELGGAQAFADKAGVSFWTVQDWLRKDTIPTLGNLCQIAKRFNVTLDELAFSNLERN